METTGKALVQHWGWAAKKGLMNKNTAGGIKAACAQVLSALDNWETIDVAGLDVEDALTRFEHLKGKNFKPRVLATYQQRFRQGVASFLAYTQDPTGWKPKAIPRATRPARNGGGAGHAPVETTVQPLPTTGLVEYPFPIRDGQTARLILPRDLKGAEVRRLTAFMTTLAVDYEASAN